MPRLSSCRAAPSTATRSPSVRAGRRTGCAARPVTESTQVGAGALRSTAASSRQGTRTLTFTGSSRGACQEQRCRPMGPAARRRTFGGSCPTCARLSRRPKRDVQGDAQVGEQIFWSKGGCGACHRVGRKGGAYGPDLTRIGRSRSVEHLRASLLDPDDDLPPGYFVVRAVHRDGRTTTGIGVAFDDFSAQLWGLDRKAALIPSRGGSLPRTGIHVPDAFRVW